MFLVFYFVSFVYFNESLNDKVTLCESLESTNPYCNDWFTQKEIAARKSGK